MFCFYSCGSVCICTLLATFSRGSLPDIQVVRDWVSDDGRHHAVLQPNFLRTLLSERCHQPHTLQHHVKEVQGGSMHSVRR